MDTLLPGITAERVPTSRLTVNVLSVARRTDGSIAESTGESAAVLFVHGNVPSSLFWQPMMLALPETFRPLAIDLRGFGDTDDEPVDASRGVRDFSDDLAAAIDALGLDTVHLVGWSMGGGVVLQYLGSIGAVPGWPGGQACPPQPMVAQTRAVLNGYTVAGGHYREVVIEDAGHGPHLDQPEQFMAELTDHLAGP